LPAEVNSKPHERVHQFADYGRLVAVGHAIDEVLGPGPRREKGAAEHVGFDIDHDEVFATINDGERMPDAGDRMTRRLDNTFDLVARGERTHVVEDAGLSGLDGVAQAGGAIALRGPTDAGERGARLADIEISDSYNVEP